MALPDKEFLTLLRQWELPLRIFAKRFEPQDFDDLVQETMIKAWTHRDQFIPGSNMRSWLFTICRHHARDANRGGRLAIASMPDGAEEWHPSFARKARQADVLELKEVGRFLRKIDPFHLTPMMMIAGGLDYKQAAQALHLPVGTVKSRVSRGREKLNLMLAQPA